MATPRAHDHDAGGDPAVLQAKADLRDEAWTALEDAGASRFPGARNRIPNFVGAEDAAERLRATAAWADAHVVKCNPDSPQWPVRQRALEEGARLGKGGGFADLEFAITGAAGLLADDVVVATTVHDSQVVAPGRIPLHEHDVRLDLVVTPTRTIEVPDAPRGAPRIDWAALTDEKVAAIPLLARLRDRGDHRASQ